MALEHTMADRAETRLIGASIRTANSRAHEIGAFWGQLFGTGHFDRIPNKDGSDVYSVYTDYESDHTGEYTLFVGCPVSSLDEIPPGMSALTLPAGQLARLTLPASDPGTVAGTWQLIYGSPLEAQRAYTADFDRYTTPADGGEQQAEIWLSVR